MTTIDIAITQFGGLKGLAAALHATPQHVTNWRRRGIPADRVLAVSRATEWRVTPHQLRPDIYPNPTDGLPPEVAETKKEAA